MRNYARDTYGQISYWTEWQGDRLVVRDADGTLLGWIENGKTYGRNGQIVSYGENVAALVQ